MPNKRKWAPKRNSFFDCDLCGKEFGDPITLKKHIKRKHAADAGQKQFVCDICDKGFTRVSTLRKHLRTHINKEHCSSDVGGKNFASTDFCFETEGHAPAAVVKKIKKSFKCDVCEKSFTRASSVAVHMKIHTGEKPFKCEICDKKFTRSSSVTTHMRTHTGEKPFKCRTCGQGFAHSSHCRLHERSHTGEKPYKCDMCDKTFTRPGNMKNHYRCHAKNRQLKCDICGKVFSSFQPRAFELHKFEHELKGAEPSQPTEATDPNVVLTCSEVAGSLVVENSSTCIVNVKQDGTGYIVEGEAPQCEFATVVFT